MLSRWQSTIVDEQGNVQPLANLTVRLESDQSLAKMWASPGTTQPLPDGMVQADGNGYAFFYAEGGLYRITSVALGIDWRAVPLGELAGMDVADLGLGTAATRDVGTEPEEVPTNDDLGSAAFLNLSIEDIQWIGTPIGGYITPFEAPPTDDPRFRYALCTAGHTGPGGYNNGVLINESVSGSGALIIANADISLAGSPMDELNIPLINTEGRFIGAGDNEALEFDAFQNIVGEAGSFLHTFGSGLSGVLKTEEIITTAYYGVAGTNTVSKITLDTSLDPSLRTSTETRPKTHRLPHYRRIK